MAPHSGDLKIFVDFTDSGKFHTKLQRELLPRLKGPGSATSSITASTTMASLATPTPTTGCTPPRDDLAAAVILSDKGNDAAVVTGAVQAAVPTQISRPGGKKTRSSKVQPGTSSKILGSSSVVLETTVDPKGGADLFASVSAADMGALRGRFGSDLDSGRVVIKGKCPNCGTVVTDRDQSKRASQRSHAYCRPLRF